MTDSFKYNNYKFFFRHNTLAIIYHFQLPFHNVIVDLYPTLEFTVPKQYLNNMINKVILEKLVFNLGIVESISYWKATCNINYEILCGHLTEEQISMWKKLFFYGLGEFRYKNDINTDIQSFVTISSIDEIVTTSIDDSINNTDNNTDFLDKIIVPVGGGKDSNVTVEELKVNHTIIPFVININNPIRNCINAAGFDEKNSVLVNRQLDTTLLRLNKEGALNGHTPFSALVAFSTLIAAELTNTSLIALSNESSANESTVVNNEFDIINHQYSKSFRFEKNFREYYSRFISPKYNYFSYLRPFSELSIAEKFSHMKQYHKIFRSCNVGSKKDNIWCCNCPKCLFVYIILLPFIPQDELIDIFGQNLLENNELQDTLFQLTGLSETKPFECVGTVSETRAAIAKYLDTNAPSGIILPYIDKVPIRQIDSDCNNFNIILNSYNKNNFIPGNI